MVMRQLAYAASKKGYVRSALILLQLILRLIDVLACDKVQNLTIHLVIERKQLDMLNSL